MDNALLGARLVLVGIFGLACAAKLADLEGSRQALLGFGIQARLAGPLGLLLPVAELSVALALLSGPATWWGALLGGLLLLAFVAGIGWNLVHGRRPDCHCFGQVHSAPAGWSVLLRNLALVALAEVLVAVGPARPVPDLYGWLGSLGTGEFLAVAASAGVLGLLVSAVWLLARLRADQQRLLARTELLTSESPAASRPSTALAPAAGVPQASPPPAPVPGVPMGTPAPPFRLPRLGGGMLGLEDLLGAAKPVLLSFVDPDCGPCTALLPQLGRWQRERSDLTLALVSRGREAANHAEVAEHGLATVLLQRDREVAAAYQIQGTPSMVLVQPDGTIGSVPAAGADAIRTLVDRTSGSPTRNPVAPAEHLAIGSVPVLVESAEAAPPGQPGARPRPHPAVAATSLDDDVVVYDPRTGQGHVLNHTAAHIWTLLDGTRTTTSLARALATSYDLPEPQALADVQALVRDLQRAELVVLD